ncbi:hypothetical protein OE88DRAFT_1812604 [Heliocybe sulcata]|uniref:Protein kinase domain-containing protein n=1 Tax=Heliocybe sulcata TaxID=5364 RepID=A0A5C3MM30_9AGAM|nr:hypothetical protein OE88DRAFT_1812604 [Heliocybe sulcata]
MHDALIAHCGAYSKVGMLDRDFGPCNILFVTHGNRDVRGILIDWDLCRRVETLNSEGACLRGRTGTWQFISHWLLMTPGKPHTLQDDLQSFFWTLLHTALRIIPSSLSGMPLANMLSKVFDEARWDDDLGYYVGGSQKYMIISKGNYILQNGIAGHTPIIFNHPATPLNKLLHSLRRLFRYWDMCINDVDGDLSDIARSESEKLLTSEAIIKLFKDAYIDPDWSHEIADRKEGFVPKEGRPGGSSSKRAIAKLETSEQRRKTQRKSQSGDATSSRLEMLDE